MSEVETKSSGEFLPAENSQSAVPFAPTAETLAAELAQPTVKAKPNEDNKDNKGPSKPVEEPYDFDRCTIQIGIQLLPADGNPAGRPIVVGVRNHADAPIIRFMHQHELGTLPDAILGGDHDRMIELLETYRQLTSD